MVTLSLDDCRRLCDTARETTFSDPREAIRLAEDALSAAERLPNREDPALQDLLGHICGVLGSARNAASDLSGADGAFARAGSFLASGTGSPGGLLLLPASARRAAASPGLLSPTGQSRSTRSSGTTICTAGTDKGLSHKSEIPRLLRFTSRPSAVTGNVSRGVARGLHNKLDISACGVKEPSRGCNVRSLHALPRPINLIAWIGSRSSPASDGHLEAAEELLLSAQRFFS
jgi:hypothetical protein